MSNLEFSPAKITIDKAEYDFYKAEIVRLENFIKSPQDRMSDPLFAEAIGLIMRHVSAKEVEQMIGVRFLPTTDITYQKTLVYLQKV